MINVHLAARVEGLAVPLTTTVVATWLWERLRRAFSAAWAAVLMTNHLHVVTPAVGRQWARDRVTRLLAGLRRSNNPGARNRWAPVELPDVIPDLKHQRRVIRYVALNPCRAGLVDDPLRWPWSTHRDVVGAIADPWVTAPRLARELRRPSRGFAEAQHAYVSGDPSVAIAGTPFPTASTPTGVAIYPLSALIEAAASATRAEPTDIGRRGPTRALFLQLAQRHGWRDTGQLAAMCNLSRRAVRWNLRRTDAPGLRAAELCLGDPRLRDGLSPIEFPPMVLSRCDTPGVAGRIGPFRKLEVG